MSAPRARPRWALLMSARLSRMWSRARHSWLTVLGFYYVILLRVLKVCACCCDEPRAPDAVCSQAMYVWLMVTILYIAIHDLLVLQLPVGFLL